MSLHVAVTLSWMYLLFSHIVKEDDEKSSISNYMASLGYWTCSTPEKLCFTTYQWQMDLRNWCFSPTYLQGMWTEETRISVQSKLKKRKAPLWKGQHPLGFSCNSNFEQCDLGLQEYATMDVYVRLGSHAQENELHFDYDDFNLNSPSDVEENVNAF